MNTTGALDLTWDPEQNGFRQGSGVRADVANPRAFWTLDIGARASGFNNLLAFFNVPRGTLSIYAGDVISLVNGAISFPFQIDFRLLHGVDRCIFDQNPLGASCIIKSAADLAREGLLFQWGGLMADSYLLRARLLLADGSTQRVQTTFFARVHPGLNSSHSRAAVGGFVG